MSTREGGVVSIGETNVDISVHVLHVILSDISIPIVVKVLPLHEVERAAAVGMIRYGYPFVGVHGIFDLTVRLTNRTSDPCGGFLGGIVKRPEEIAVGADAMSGLIKASLE